jgi:hypothetical protein
MEIAMRKPLLSLVFFGVFVFLTATAAAAAEKIITSQDTDAILALANEYGKATLGTTKSGNPKIDVETKGDSFVIYFLGCAEGKDCAAINFWNYTKGTKVKLEDINTLNEKSPFIRSYLDEDGDFIMEMDAMLRYGMTEKNLRLYFDLWSEGIQKIKEQI